MHRACKYDERSCGLTRQNRRRGVHQVGVQRDTRRRTQSGQTQQILRQRRVQRRTFRECGRQRAYRQDCRRVSQRTHNPRNSHDKRRDSSRQRNRSKGVHEPKSTLDAQSQRRNESRDNRRESVCALPVSFHDNSADERKRFFRRQERVLQNEF